MKTFSSIRTEKPGAAIAKAAPEAAYSMSLVGEDRFAIIAAVNQGIDSHLESCFVPARGDSFRLRNPAGIRGKISGSRLECRVSPQSLPVLVRRLLESGDETAAALASDICQTLQIELI